MAQISPYNTIINTTTTYADCITSKLTSLEEELTVKNVLFIAPSRQYADTVAKNMDRDLTKKGVGCDIRSRSYKIEVNTNKATVHIITELFGRPQNIYTVED